MWEKFGLVLLRFHENYYPPSRANRFLLEIPLLMTSKMEYILEQLRMNKWESTWKRKVFFLRTKRKNNYCSSTTFLMNHTQRLWTQTEVDIHSPPFTPAVFSSSLLSVCLIFSMVCCWEWFQEKRSKNETQRAVRKVIMTCHLIQKRKQTKHPTLMISLSKQYH